MADVIHVKAPDLMQAATTVAEHLETATVSPSAVAPSHAVASPVDAAASSAAGAIHTKMAAMSAEIAPKGPAIQHAGAAAAASLQAQDTANAARMPSVPSAPTPHVQAMGGGWKRGPDQPGTGPRDPNPRFPGRDNRGRFGSSNTGSQDGAAAAERRLQKEEADTGKTFVRQQIKVQIIDPKTGQPRLDPQTGKPLSRFYDALEPVAGQPGKYVGIEVKSGTADLTRTQKIFDTAVSPETPATGTLNGEPVEITRAIKLEAPQFVPEAPAAPEPAPPEAVARPPIEGPLEGGFGAGPSQPIGPRLITPGHHEQHVIGDWDPDPEAIR